MTAPDEPTMFRLSWLSPIWPRPTTPIIDAAMSTRPAGGLEYLTYAGGEPARGFQEVAFGDGAHAPAPLDLAAITRLSDAAFEASTLTKFEIVLAELTANQTDEQDDERVHEIDPRFDEPNGWIYAKHRVHRGTRFHFESGDVPRLRFFPVIPEGEQQLPRKTETLG